MFRFWILERFTPKSWYQRLKTLSVLEYLARFKTNFLFRDFFLVKSVLS